MGRVIAIMNQKGGVGKTTTALNLGAALAERDLRVLLIDLDSQANLTQGLGMEAEDLDQSIYAPLTTPGTRLESIIQETKWDGLHLAPSHIDLSGWEDEMPEAGELGSRLKDAIGELPSHYDYILIDCLPSLSLLSINAMNAAREVFIPVQAHPFGLKGLTKLYEVFELVRDQMNPGLEITGVLITMFDTRTNVSRDVVEHLRRDAHFAARIFETILRLNIKIAESQGHGVPVIHYDRGCHGAQAYRALAEEVMAMPTPETPKVPEARENDKTHLQASGQSG